MHRRVEQILFGVISGVISYYVAPALPQISTTAAWLQYANEPAIRFVGVLAVTWYVLLLLVDWLRTQRQRKNASIGVIGFGPKRMRYVRDKGVIRHFGVDWKYKYGRQSLDDEMSALAKGPFCPECGSEMVTDKEERIIRRDKPFWKCPGCTFKTNRPTDFLYEESEAVERLVVREYEVDQNRLDDLSPVDRD